MACLLLPSGAKPTRYDIRIEPDLEKQVFEGSVTIGIEVLETIVSIKLNVHELNIQRTTLNDASGNPIPIASTKTDRNLQTFKILFEHHISANSNLFLHLKFSGALRTDGTGFHMPAGSYMASTHMEPSFARTVFPCFDEPAFKATFSVTLVLTKHLTCLGNMPIKTTSVRTSKSDPKKVIEFEETEIMSTYLVAFAVGEFDFVDTLDFRIPLRAYCPPEYPIEHCRYALETAGRSLEILERMLEIEYPLPKLDLLLVPGSVGGMENWGLITLSIEAMVIAPDNTAADKVSSTQTVAHEIAHQWFGNLVTMSSWDNCWLKEGLSEWAELEVRELMVGNLEPFQDFVADGLQWALLVDSRRFGHPLEVVIDGTVVIKPFFDEITYKKGCAVLRMLSCNLGSGVFLEGVRLYLRLHAYNNTQSDDLWNAMSHVSGIDIGAFMRPWTMTAGYPVISVEEDERSGGINVTQVLFRMLGTEIGNETVYPVALRISSETGMSGDLLKTKTKTIKMPLNFYTLNAGQAGFYRVAYSSTLLRNFCEGLPKGHLCVEDRIGIISNTAVLAMSCHRSRRTSELLSLIQNFEDEESYFVWKTIISVLNELKNSLLFENEKLRGAFDRFYKHVVKKCLYRKGKFSLDDDLNEQRFKAMMFGNAGGDEKVFAAAELMFERFVNGREKAINPNLRAEVFKLVLSNGGKKEYWKLKTRLSNASAAERNDILCSLGYSQNSACIKKTLKRALSTESISRSEMCKTLQSLATHKKGIAALWKFITSGVWMQNPVISLEKIAPVGGYVLGAYTKMEQCDNARKFLEKIDTQSFGVNLEQVFDAVGVRAKWLERDREDLKEWLQRNGYGFTKPDRSRRLFSRRWQQLWTPTI